MARWILSFSRGFGAPVPESVQYILPAVVSRAMLCGLINPVVTRASGLEPSRLARQILPSLTLFVPASTQYIFGGLLVRSRATARGAVAGPSSDCPPNVLVSRRSSTPEPSRLARRILSLVASVQYILPPVTSKAMPLGTRKKFSKVRRVSTFEPSRLAHWILSSCRGLGLPVPESVQYIFPIALGTVLPKLPANIRKSPNPTSPSPSRSNWVSYLSSP